MTQHGFAGMVGVPKAAVLGVVVVCGFGAIITALVADPPSAARAGGQSSEPARDSAGRRTAIEAAEPDLSEFWSGREYPSYDHPDYSKIAATFPKLEGRELADAVVDLRYHEPLPEGYARAVAECWPLLSPYEKITQLRDHWHESRCPEMELRLVEDSRKPFEHAEWHVDHLPSTALVRLLELRPQAVRAIILEEIGRPDPSLNGEALLALPDAVLPQFDDHFRALLGGAHGDWWKFPQVLERYASAALLPEVKRIAERPWACSIQEALLGYWIKHDRTGGLDAVARAARRRGPKETGCWREVLSGVLPRYWGPDAEALCLSFLSDEGVALDAVRVLAQQGSESCLEQLVAWAGEQPSTTRHEAVGYIAESKRWELDAVARDRLWKMIETYEARDIYREALAR